MSGNTRCFCISLSLTARTASKSVVMASRSSSGTPNSFEAEIAISRAEAKFDTTKWVTRLTRFSLDLEIASCMADSSNRPSWTSRWARPPKAARPVAAIGAIALSFMDLDKFPGDRKCLVYYLMPGRQLSNASQVSHRTLELLRDRVPIKHLLRSCGFLIGQHRDPVSR